MKSHRKATQIVYTQSLSTRSTKKGSSLNVPSYRRPSVVAPLSSEDSILESSLHRASDVSSDYKKRLHLVINNALAKARKSTIERGVGK